MRNTIILLLIFSGSLGAQSNNIFKGGKGQGYISAPFVNTVSNIFQGGEDDGYSLEPYVNTNSIFDGGENDGYSLEPFINTNSIFEGGEDDGYSSLSLRVPFVWTGSVGTSWTIAGNWNFNLIPGIYREVIIPPGVNNWPFLNAGLLNIGDNPNNGLYKCASLWIQENAQLFTRVNNRIENYGLLTIDGTMEVRNPSANAFKNLPGGTIVITQNGELRIKP